MKKILIRAEVPDEMESKIPQLIVSIDSWLCTREIIEPPSDEIRSKALELYESEETTYHTEDIEEMAKWTFKRLGL